MPAFGLSPEEQAALEAENKRIRAQDAATFAIHDKILGDEALFAQMLAQSKAAETAAIARGEIKGPGSIGTFDPGTRTGTAVPPQNPLTAVAARVNAAAPSLSIGGLTPMMTLGLAAGAAGLAYLFFKPSAKKPGSGSGPGPAKTGTAAGGATPAKAAGDRYRRRGWRW